MTETSIVPQSSFIAPVAGVQTALLRYQAQKEFIDGVLRSGVDFGEPFPGSDKPSLKKPGAEKMASFFGLMPRFEDVQTVEDWMGEQHGSEPFFYYRQKCNLYRGDLLVASADGSCNSWEKKYRYRNADRVCPTCGKATIFRSKQKPEWYCWAKKGGCGATYPVNDIRITEQETGQVRNSDIAEQVNTILKMAQKRALVAAVLIATNASDYFTQDVDDFVDAEWHEAPQQPPVGNMPPMPEPPAQKLPIDELDYSVLPAEMLFVKNSAGALYIDLPTDKLAHMANSLRKSLKDNHLEENEKASQLTKLETAEAILKLRATTTTARA
jgi:predicted RNA-binding Zn-ribbon protein involved in translation (DUF1610 family)